MGSSFAQQNTLDGLAKLIYGSSGTKISETGSVQLGDAAKYQEQGSVSAGGNINTAPTISGVSGSAQVTIGETGVADKFASAVKDLFTIQKDSTSSLLAALAPTSSATGTGADSAKDPAKEGGESDTSKRNLLIAGAVLLAGLVWWFIKRK